jgi:hypothetical protein
MENGHLYLASIRAFGPESTIVVLPTQEIAKAFSEERLTPITTPESDSTSSTTHENPKSDKLTSCPTVSD